MRIRFFDIAIVIAAIAAGTGYGALSVPDPDCYDSATRKAIEAFVRNHPFEVMQHSSHSAHIKTIGGMWAVSKDLLTAEERRYWRERHPQQSADELRYIQQAAERQIDQFVFNKPPTADVTKGVKMGTSARCTIDVLFDLTVSPDMASPVPINVFSPFRGMPRIEQRVPVRLTVSAPRFAWEPVAISIDKDADWFRDLLK